MNANNHISETEFLLFQQNRMNQQDKINFLEHICSCNYCSDQLTALMEDNMIAAPRDMKDNILRAAKRPEVQISMKAKETTKQMQLFLYSLKVGTATVGALLLLMLTMNFSEIESAPNIPENIPMSMDANSSIEENTSLIDTIRDGMNSISSRMLDFSNNIMKTEVTNNDQKER